MLGEDATGSLSKARRPPRIIDTDDEDEDEDVRSRPTAKPGLAGKQKARVVLSDSEDGDEVSVTAPADARPDTACGGRKEASLGGSTSSRADGDDDEIDTSRGDSFIDNDDDEGEEPATASDTASNSDSDDESVRGTVSNFRAAPVVPPARKVPPPAAAPSFQAPLRSVGNTASSSLFNKSAAAKPDLHSYSFGAQRAPPSSATSSAGLSLKERLFAKVQEQQKRIGVPISVPREGARGSPPAGREGFAIGALSSSL